MVLEKLFWIMNMPYQSAHQIEVNSSAIFIIKTSFFQGWLYSNQNHTFCEENIENYFNVSVMDVFFLFSFTISIQSQKID